MCVYVRTSVCECVLLMWLEKEILELQGKEQNNLFRDSWSHRRGSNKITILNPKANKIYSSTIPDARLSFDLEKKNFRACVQQDVALLLNLNVTHYIESNMFLQVRISVALQWKVAIRISRKRWNVEHLCLTKKCNCLQARLAQSVERKALNLVVVGSSPTVGVFQFSALRTQSLCKCVFLGIRPRRSWPFS